MQRVVGLIGDLARNPEYVGSVDATCYHCVSHKMIVVML